MADDNNPRSPRGGDPFARGGAPLPPAGSGAASDPLAELARLIGQNDPFADFGRDAGRTPTAAEPRHWPGEVPQDDWRTGSLDADADRHLDDGAYRHPDPGAGGFAEPDADRYAQPRPNQYSDAGADHYADAGGDRYAQPQPPLADPYSPYGTGAYPERDPLPAPLGHATDRMPGQHPFEIPHADDLRMDDARYASGGDARQFADHAQAYRQAPAQAPADAQQYQDEPYYRDEAPATPVPGSYRSEDYAEEHPAPRRRGGLVVVMAVLGLAVVGTAGAFGYRAMFGPSTLAAPPPVIKADATPSKVVPAVQSNEQQSNKASYDRVGDRAQGEKVVVREEQPVELKDAGKPPAPRLVLPGATGATPSPPGAASPPSLLSTPSASTASSPPPTPQTSALNEPKKVRTVTIRPDKSGAFGSVPAGQRPSPPANAASAFPDPPPPTSRGVASRSVPAPASAPASANEPLALAPRNAPAADAPRARAVAAPSAPAARAAAGSYAVQVASQRSEADAQASFRALQARFPNQLASREPIIRRADLGDKGTYFRALVGPFSSSEQAAEFCSSLKAAGGQCLIQRN